MSTRRIAIRPLASRCGVLLFAHLLFFGNGIPSDMGVLQMSARLSMITGR
jgi:hypothetical protein